MREMEVFRFKSKIESKRDIFTSANLLDCEWDAMLEKAKLGSSLPCTHTQKRKFEDMLSKLSSPRVSAALTTALVLLVLFSFVFSGMFSSRYRGNVDRIIRQRRSVPVVNVSSKYI